MKVGVAIDVYQNSLALKKGVAKESRINLTLNRLVITRTDISVHTYIVELYILSQKIHSTMNLHVYT